MTEQQETILVTGAAGFIGFHTAKALLERGQQVVGCDNFVPYYDVRLKKDRVHNLQKYPNFSFVRLDICDFPKLKSLFHQHTITRICHLAAQAGVRYSLTNPFAYQKANLEGFLNIIECARKFEVKNFVYASSSSVYGGNTKTPFAVEDDVSRPISLYAATKKANELMAYTYHHLYGLPTTGLRFFTAYGPWGRPDMALFKFTKAILKDEEIEVYNFGKMKRDFTYIDDVVQGILKSLDMPSAYEIFNLGNSNTVELTYFIECLEKVLGKKARKKLCPIQPGDVPETVADIRHSTEKLGFEPRVKIEEGIERFVAWYHDYYAQRQEKDSLYHEKT